MHLQQTQSSGPGESETKAENAPLKEFIQKSSSLPFGQDIALSSISGPTYLTAQTLIQQVAYTLSDKIFTYSPETFDLDVAVKHWQKQNEKNAFGYPTGVVSMETRTGAGSIALGYVFSKDFDLTKRHIPQCIIASSSTLHQLRPALDQLSLLYSVANPFVAHVAAVDYAAGSEKGFVTDYASALTIAEELGLGLLCSTSAYEVQHMSLFAVLLATVLPTIHIYDGINVSRETTRVVDVLDQSGLYRNYQAISKVLSRMGKKHQDHEAKALQLLKAFNEELGTDYKLFEYSGHESPDSVLVVFGTVEASLASQIATSLAAKGSKVGVINVRVYRPFVEEEFIAALPRSVRQVIVLGQVMTPVAVSDQFVRSNLYSDVLSAVTFSLSRSVSVQDIKYPREYIWTPNNMFSVFRQLDRPSITLADHVGNTEEQSDVDVLPSSVKQYTFWNVDDSPSVTAPLVLGQLLSGDSASNVSVRTGHDNLVQGGAVRTDIRTSNKSIEAAYAIDTADVAIVTEEKLLNDFDILNTLKYGGTLVLRLPGVKDEDLEKRLTVGIRKALVGKKLELYVLDSAVAAEAAENNAETAALESYLVQLAFLRVARDDLFPAAHQKLAVINGSEDVLSALSEGLDKALRCIEIPSSWATVDPEVESVSLPTNINVNSFSAFERIDPEPPTLLKDWIIAAKGLAFREAYETKTALRPDLGIKTSVVHVKEHRRLTPLTYDRNIFHIEFDLGNSGLKYEIGEALGIHAENDKAEVEEFIKWYGLNPDEVVEVPSREDPDVLENRTAYQSLMQNVDIFGRPPKRFYEALSEFADDEKEKRELLALGSAEGVTEFKRRAEVDTITYADLLLEFPSAHPSFHDIVRIVSPMKRREYSIASSQRVTPNSVALLIVTVGWVDPKARDRFGQATRYLNQLKIGAPVTVSVKPSVMKLPAKTTAPIIMAGLGTGLAPFRAFVQERAWQREQGMDIGSVLLYMGSRHQREEYLYGEEWEAYQDAGIITLLGRAFSRDQPQKIYIQDRMRETMADIRQAYLRDEGSFYLCGPTWPVPDVTNVLEEAIALDAREAEKKVDPRKAIDRLKDELRYVLEVY